jgi:FlaA1/EpsC-like NDP-sugar epimerase
LNHRRSLADLLHAAIIAAALWSSFLLRFDFALNPPYGRMLAFALPLALAIKLPIFRAFALRDQAWRYVNFVDLTRVAAANLTAAAAATIGLRISAGSAFPRSIYLLDFVLCLSLMVASRAAIRLLFETRRSGHEPARTILIYGAGRAGVRLLDEILANPQTGFTVAGFIDDDPRKRDLRIHGVRVLGTGSDLSALVKKCRAVEILIALAAASGRDLTTILEHCHAAKIPARRVPALADLIETRVLVDQIREVRLEDLLGRAAIQLDDGEIRKRLDGRIVLVTGAGGSIGSELCRQIARFRPSALVGFDQGETPLYEIEREMRTRFPEVAFYPEVGNMQNRRRLQDVFNEYSPDSVYHAAAYKHVPMMESHLFEAIENNVFGTRNLVEVASKHRVEDFVLVSSDKAVRPANVMGATKRLTELICLAAGTSRGGTEFMAVRFGNVLGSSGSVIPLFRKQIAAGGPVTVTHPEMRRFFMTIPEAAQLVLQAAAMGSGGEIFVLEMGEPVKIADLARKMILLSGLQPDQDIHIEFSGVRPGEKLYEELSGSEEETLATRHPQIRIFAGSGASRDGILRDLDELRRVVENRDASRTVLMLKDLVPEYNPSSYILRRALRAEAVVA